MDWPSDRGEDHRGYDIFRNGAKMFDIKPPLDAGLWLTPDKYVAVPR